MVHNMKLLLKIILLVFGPLIIAPFIVLLLWSIVLNHNIDASFSAAPVVQTADEIDLLVRKQIVLSMNQVLVLSYSISFLIIFFGRKWWYLKLKNKKDSDQLGQQLT